MECSSHNEKKIYSLFHKASNGSVAKSPISGVSDSALNTQNLSKSIKNNQKKSRKERIFTEDVKSNRKENLPITFISISREAPENRTLANDSHNFETENEAIFHGCLRSKKVKVDHAVNQPHPLLLKATGSRNISTRDCLLAVDSAQKDVEDLQPSASRQPAALTTQKTQSDILWNLMSSSNSLCESCPPRLLAKNDRRLKEKVIVSSEINHQTKKILKLSYSSVSRIDLETDELESQYSNQTMKIESKIIKINYDKSIVEKLEQILNGQASRNITQSLISSNFVESTNSACVKAPDKIIHPLLLKKFTKHTKKPPAEPKKKENTSPLRKTGKSYVGNTPIFHNGSKQRSQSFILSSKMSKSSLQSISKASTPRRQSNSMEAAEAAWPWKGIVHIRGLNEVDSLIILDSKTGIVSHNEPKKSKENSVEIAFNESIISSITKSLDLRSRTKKIGNSNLDRLPPLPSSLRLPVNYYESSHRAQHRLQKQASFRGQQPNLINSNSNSSEDEIQSCHKRSEIPLHPALETAYASIATSLSSLAKRRCESQIWAQKHAPDKVKNILQTGPEAFVLKEWLLSLTVNSIESGSIISNNSPNLKSEISNKRRRKSVKPRNFIIPDDDDNGLDEIKLPDDEVPMESQSHVKRTVLRGGEWPKNKNYVSKTYHTILISGPNGCGKSAAVYAAAKELDFEVFEINSSCRRSGKDVMEKIGDMILNHHVQNGTKIQVRNVRDDNRDFNASLDSEFESDSRSILNVLSVSKKSRARVRQSSITRSNLSQDQATNYEEPMKADIEACVTPKEQKQSLILIEEADIIFKEDSQFWSTIENVIAISKRPIVITCNDESAIPLSDDLLYAILRFRPPPVDLAVDYMLMIAACEGHVIQRDAVKALYEERQLDLRASLNELNFWCQLAVGDINKEQSWYTSRIDARNTDIDQCSNQICVVSEGTYKKGMGWISQDIIKSGLPYLILEEELFQQTCHYWNVDIGDWEKSVHLKKWADKVKALANDKKAQFAALNMFSEYTDSMSDSDILSKSFFGTEFQVILDPCFPKISKKVFGEYPLANKLVEASSKSSYSTIPRSIPFYIRSRARNLLQTTQKLEFGSKLRLDLPSSTESRIIDSIRKHPNASSGMLHRTNFSQAFDPISYPCMHLSSTTSNFIDSSQFDRTKRIVSEDLAPYVRGIVAYYVRLQRDRERTSQLIIEGCTRGKRRRTTRAAISALEGGRRCETRPERYFGNSLNPILVGKTGNPLWIDALLRLQKPGDPAAVELQGCASTSFDNYNHV
ncbi:putative telomere length regulation protein elg1 [Golovinomyces cichoracearum]|uniref:Putative telomere length regulation protein elg1 n=1 Tax=Golovinomyces cichoracearum TaxID=62708 RepID=A0A420I9S2_9PEZI|nr:putative telomere length regulation protein elg1 [Golovinomyces cichoracearum]